jgi:hypothetical protein
MVAKRAAVRAAARMEISMMGNGIGFWLRGCEWWGGPINNWSIVRVAGNFAASLREIRH